MASYLTPASLSNPHHSTSPCLSKGSLPRPPASQPRGSQFSDRIPRLRTYIRTFVHSSAVGRLLGSQLSTLRSQYDPAFHILIDSALVCGRW